MDHPPIFSHDQPRRDFGKEIEELDRRPQNSALDRQKYLADKSTLINLWKEQVDSDEKEEKKKKQTKKNTDRDPMTAKRHALRDMRATNREEVLVERARTAAAEEQAVVDKKDAHNARRDEALAARKAQEEKDALDRLTSQQEAQEKTRQDVEFLLLRVKKVLIVENASNKIRMYFIHGCIPKSKKDDRFDDIQTSAAGIKQPRIVYQTADCQDITSGSFSGPSLFQDQDPSLLADELRGRIFMEVEGHDMFRRVDAQQVFGNYLIKKGI